MAVATLIESLSASTLHRLDPVAVGREGSRLRSQLRSRLRFRLSYASHRSELTDNGMKLQLSGRASGLFQLFDQNVNQLAGRTHVIAAEKEQVSLD
jgi:hypothetical protein